VSACLLPLLLLAAVILVWLVFRNGGYKREPLSRPPGPDWTFTGERFADPGTGEMVEVWYSARSGERAYVQAASAPIRKK